VDLWNINIISYLIPRKKRGHTLAIWRWDHCCCCCNQLTWSELLLWLHHLSPLMHNSAAWAHNNLKNFT